jgi:hypothetical protein
VRYERGREKSGERKMAAVNYQRRNNQHDVETVELVQGRVLKVETAAVDPNF